MDSVNSLGNAVRNRRKQMGMTLGDLAATSGVSAAMISGVELGKKSPTVRVLSQIAEALGCSISDLVGERVTTTPRVLRARDRKGYVDPQSGIERLSLSGELMAHGIDVVLYRLPAGSDTGDFAPHRHGVLEHLTVTRGGVRVTIAGERIDLAVGDSLVYSADVSHRYQNTGKSVAELFLIISSPRGIPASAGWGPA